MKCPYTKECPYYNTKDVCNTDYKKCVLIAFAFLDFF